MDADVKQHYLDAGKAVQKAKEMARDITEPGKSYSDIAQELESVIRSEGLEPAFPVNLSRNQEAAHYSPGLSSDREVSSSGVLKIDIGAHSSGYIADTAITVNPSGERSEMVEAARDLLQQAVDFVEPGVTVGELGRFVDERVPQEYNVVRNLTGHYVDRYTQHAGVSLPNYANDSDHELEIGDAFAVEPFLTDGSGKIKNGSAGNIYKLENDRSVRGSKERELLNSIREFNGLPFSPRWIDGFGAREKMALNRLVQQDVVHSYPVLNEVRGGTVVQAEHTVILTEDGKEVTTRPD